MALFDRLAGCSSCEVQKRTCKYCGGTIYWNVFNSKTPFNWADNSLHQCLKERELRRGY